MTNTPHREWTSGMISLSRLGRLTPALATVLVAVLIGGLGAGCSHHHVMGGFDDSSKVQVQFYEPPGATVMMRRRPHGGYTADVNHSTKNQLEDGGEYAIFNLKPSNDPYAFAYSPQDGNGVNIYGEIEVFKPESEAAHHYMAHSFVPISLLSSREDSREVFYHPSRGNSGAGLSALEMAHLAQGDVISRVYFVADLAVARNTIKDIDSHIERLRSSETVLNTHLEWIDSRFQSYRRDSLYADPTGDSFARAKDKSGENHEFIRLEADRQRLENERYEIRELVEDLLTEQRMRKRLLDTMRIINRRGSLVLATPENQWEFHDTKHQVSNDRHYGGFATGPMKAYESGDIIIPAMGEPLVVMRVGGRHRHWPEMQAAPVHSHDDSMSYNSK